ncbi:ARPC1B [Symbiodinium sp. CCMP2592]|nr:ARPC1B [Symbiodinium sp. CCMP2592]
MLTVMLMVRTGIAVALGWAGACWLAVTPDIKDILLNAVALLFILEIDELLYKVLAPKHAIKFMSSIRALPVGHRKTWAGVDVYCVLKLFIVTLVLVLFIGCNVIHNAKEAQQAKDVLCGGNQDFVHGVHPELGLVAVADTKPFKPHAGFEIPGMRKVLDDVVSKYDLDTFVRVGGSWGRVQEDDESPIILHSEDGVNQLSDWVKLPLNSASMPVACRDQEIGGIVYYPGTEIPAWGPAGSTFAAFTSWAWQSLTAMTGATNCTQARTFCDDMAMPLVRVLCPDTCGCNVADSGITFDYGCLEQCRGTVGAFRESLEQAPCRDFTGEAQRQQAWQRFWTLYWSGGSGDTLRDYLQGNCSVVPVPKFCNFYPWTHHGQRDVELRPLTVLCPETCGCADSSDSDSVTWCPKSCVSREAG